MYSRFDTALNATEARGQATHVNVPSRCGEDLTRNRITSSAPLLINLDLTTNLPSTSPNPLTVIRPRP